MNKLKTRSEHLKTILLKQRFTVGAPIPSERQLSERYRVSRGTISKVVSELVAEGILERKWGKGVFYLGSGPKRIFVLLKMSMMTRAANPFAWFVSLDFLKGILAASRAGVSVELCESLEEFERLRKGASGPHGMICLSNAWSGGIPEDVPCVLLNFGSPSRLPSVTCRIRDGVSLGTSHLIAKGCRRIAFIGGPFDSDIQAERLDGCKDALSKRSLHIRKEDITECGYGEDEGERAARALFTGRDRPDAVVCSDDLRAFGVCRALKALGLSIPRDVGVLGFDDIPGAAEADPPLSTLKYPRVEMGERAVAMLSKLISGTPCPNEELDMELILRETC